MLHTASTVSRANAGFIPRTLESLWSQSDANCAKSQLRGSGCNVDTWQLSMYSANLDQLSRCAFLLFLPRQ